eukprot:jgi/Bigna1/130046/aug1.10_g4754
MKSIRENEKNSLPSRQAGKPCDDETERYRIPEANAPNPAPCSAGLYVAKRTAMYLGKVVDQNRNLLRNIDLITHHEMEKEPNMKRDSMASFVSYFVSVRKEVVQRARDQAVFYHEIEAKVTKPLTEWHKLAQDRLSELKKNLKSANDITSGEQRKLGKEKEAVAKLWVAVEAIDVDNAPKKYQKALDKFEVAQRRLAQIEGKFKLFEREQNEKLGKLVDAMENLELERLARLSEAFRIYNSLVSKLSLRVGAQSSISIRTILSNRVP